MGSFLYASVSTTIYRARSAYNSSCGAPVPVGGTGKVVLWTFNEYYEYLITIIGQIVEMVTVHWSNALPGDDVDLGTK